MIGLLIISHSAAIARGVKELAEQMAQGQVPIAAAGGTLEGDLGTSADHISAALAELHGVQSVLVLVDMGSAVMSAEMALELSGVAHLISGAPLVEGALVAAVEATHPDASLEAVARAAERALETKGIASTAPSSAAPALPAASPPSSATTLEETLTISNKVGLHMRPAKEFVKLASQFQSSISVRNLDRPERPAGDAKRMIDVMKLGVAQGQRLLLQIDGPDAEAAIAALRAMVAAKFGEES